MRSQPSEDSRSVIQKAVSGFKFTLFAQVAALMLSVAKSVILPKIMTVEDYGYWQTYVLYATYVGVFALGFNDGVYLLYGKYQYQDLPFPRLRSANRYYLGMMAGFTLLGAAACMLFSDPSRRVAMLGVCADIMFMGVNTLMIYILQVTNQMKAYSLYSTVDKLIMLLSVLAMALLPARSFHYAVIADAGSRAVVSVCLLIRCREVVFGEKAPAEEGKKEFLRNIKIGISLMIANLMGMFVTGIGRMIIDFFGVIEDYAFYSFGVTITNLVLVFITAVSLVLYPALKRLPEEGYRNYYTGLNSGVRFFNVLCLGLYFPAVVFIRFFLPKYAPIFDYLHILFAVIVLQAKMQLLINTFYNVLREEKALLKANMGCVGLFLLLALVSFRFTRNVTAIAACTMAAMLARCYASEVFIRKKLGVAVDKMMWLEAAFVVCYVLMISFVPFPAALGLYAAMLLAFLALDRKNTLALLKNIRNMRRGA